MDWSKGYSTSFYLSILDPVTWRDTERIEITDAGVSYTNTGLRSSASISSRNYDIGREQWVRLWAMIEQESDTAHVPLFTGLATSPETQVNGIIKSYPLECYSVLKPAEDILLPRGWYATEGADGASVIHDLLKVTNVPVIVDPYSPRLSQTIIAEDGESNLTMADKILQAINWRLKISGDGTIMICSQATDPTTVFGLDCDMIEPSFKVTKDWFSCPNVFRAVSGDTYGIARDDAEDSLLSTVNRGREIWAEESDCKLNASETLGEYAKRRLKELQVTEAVIPYTRRFHPEVYVGDVVSLQYPEQGLNGDYKVLSQKIDIGTGIRVSEEVTLI